VDAISFIISALRSKNPPFMRNTPPFMRRDGGKVHCLCVDSSTVYSWIFLLGTGPFHSCIGVSGFTNKCGNVFGSLGLRLTYQLLDQRGWHPHAFVLLHGSGRDAIVCNKTPRLRGVCYIIRQATLALGCFAILYIETPFLGGFRYIQRHGPYCSICQGRSKTRPLWRSKSRPQVSMKLLRLRGRRAAGA
jgi:hypothetical protein